MSALPRPDLPSGSHRDLVAALHDLHHRAGWPSLRTLARETGVSHTTVSKVFSAPALPSWGTLELLVEAMGGDVAVFRALWLAASSPTDGSSTTAPRIAGRRAELAAVRRHLEGGAGLLLVTGEAGIGKTTLISAAVGTSDVFVAVGHCLPLSAEVPLLPLVDALRLTYACDDGQWIKEALADCPPYVRTSLSLLLPELGAAEGAQVHEDPWGLERLFTSVVGTLRALASTRPFALHVEDCHWADRSTLDLLAHMTTRPAGFPVVATWRTGDSDVAEGHTQWLSRARWTAGVATLDLGPLTLEETAQQLRLLAGAEADLHDDAVRRIQARSQGLPLYTAQLAEAPAETELPRHLAELLDRRLGDIDDAAWHVARVLGLAQRPVGRETLLVASGLEPAELDDALRRLAQRRLLRRTDGDGAGLAHPLFVEAIARRLVPGETAVVHSRLAEALAAQPDAEPGVIAGHWQAAGRPDREVAPRVATARQAGERFAYRDELNAWLRVLELWDAGHVEGGVQLWNVLSGALHASMELADFDTGGPLVQRALDLDLPDRARARVLQRAGEFRWHQGRVEPAVDHLGRAVALLERLPPSGDLVEVLDVRIGLFIQAGRFAEAQADVRRALDALDAREDLRQRRRVLNWSAWLRMWAGDTEAALAEARRAQEIVLPEPDPVADVSLAINFTDILLHAAAPVARVEEAARDALHEVEVWNLEQTYLNVLVRGNVACAHLRAGDVRAARQIIEPVACTDPSTTTSSAHAVLAAIELREGHLDAALDRCSAADKQVRNHDQNWTEGVPLDADVKLWAGRSDAALSLLHEALAIALTGEAARVAAPLLSMFARAHADDLEGRNAGEEERRQVSARLHRLLADSAVDPFGTGALGVAVPALLASWRAEVARIDGTATVEVWSRAAAQWDRLTRPHDAAYCRWRAAQIAVREGHGTVAARLLTRAATDARQHVPLSEAIAATRASASPTSPSRR